MAEPARRTRAVTPSRTSGASPRPGRPLRPVDLARAVGLSPEMARRYEQWGYLPPAERSPTGRRLYGPQHLHAMVAARVMRTGYGWKSALNIMRHLHGGDLGGALALVDERHAALHRQRLEVDETLRALQTLAEAGPPPGGSHVAAENAAAQPRLPGTHALLRIAEAAQRVGVRVSAVRFWEEQGLLRPQRNTSSGYRLYDAEQLLRLHIVAVLRRANYRFDAIRAVLDELAGGQPSTALTAIQRRREELTRASDDCSRATAAFWDYAAAVLGKAAAPRAASAPTAGRQECGGQTSR
ncbi:MAG: MerR family transcriptional regulator [Chloroflexi bacterium]|nr:MerR family transcriptional regulator [Chloroflexota bacterium]